MEENNIMGITEVRQDGLYLDGEKFFMLSGDFHFFRTHPDGWRRRLRLMKDFGFTAVTTYVAWNLHEPKPGVYNFEGTADIARFLKEADEEGLKVILRLSPYMCAEWEMGGLPSWLLSDRTLCLRCRDPKYMEAVRRYSKVLCEKVRPYLYTNGGPVILLGLENEYGSFGNDKGYLYELADMYREEGMDVPFMSANGADPFKYYNGTIPEYWNGVDSSAGPGGIKELDRLIAMQPDKQPMAGEAWCGSIMFWGKSFSLNCGIDKAAVYMTEALEKGAAINFYMICGGTNFAFFSGALAIDGHYNSLLTSYDYDAPISEDGVPREKYFAMRDALDKFLGKPARPHIAPEHKVQEIKDIKLDECAPLFDNLDALSTYAKYHFRTVCMEDIGQDYGFILYETDVEYTDPRPRHLVLDDLHDRATVYADGKYLGTYMREADNKDIVFCIPEGGCKLSILVENLGRVGYGYKMYEPKGILGAVRYKIKNPDGSFLYNYATAMGFMTRSLPMHDISGVVYENKKAPDGQPAFWRGTFRAEAGVDTFLDTKGFGHGFVFINGFNIGKFWPGVGPQRTLYVPGEILKEENTIELFDLHTSEIPTTISCIDHAILTEIPKEDQSLKNFELL